jgi:hypothetical protein
LARVPKTVFALNISTYQALAKEKEKEYERRKTRRRRRRDFFFPMRRI